MLWSEFKTKVLTDLPVDKNRINIATGNPNYLDQQITHCIQRIQELVPFYQGGHETTYGTDDLVLQGLASVGRLPDGCRPLDAYYRKVGKQCVSQPLWSYAWANRFDLICGNPRVTGGQFYIAIDPWAKEFTVFPSVFDEHQISLYWAGVRTEFADADETPFDDGVVECVGLFVKANIARQVDHDLNEFSSYMISYRQRLGTLFAGTKDRVTLSMNFDSGSFGKCANAITSCACRPEVPVDDTDSFVAFGDSGDPATIANTDAVANLVKSLEPNLVMHLGDTNYPSGEPSQFQQVLIKQYGIYIPNNFLLSYGNHDIDTDGGVFLDNLLTKQKALNDGKTYYSYILPGGRAQLFVLDTNGDPSEQGEWLQAMLSTSCLWNIVCMHKSPYTSDVSHAPGDVAWRFPFKDWGAHVVLSAHGHNYERLWVDDFQYVVCGLGGAPKRGFVSPPTAGSQFRYNTFYGCLYITVTKTLLQITFYDTRGEVVDSIQFEGDGTCQSIPPVPPPDPGNWCQLRGSLYPEGVVAAAIGCWYRRSDGVNYEFWYKDSGGTGPTGWILTEKLA